MADTQLVPLKNKLQGKVAIVTGGASGIGEATARLFAQHGARGVVIADIQTEKGRLVAESIGSSRCSFILCDVTDEEQVKSMVESTVKKYGGLDIMFSNAGTIIVGKQTVLDLDFPLFDRVMNTNARGMAACVKHAALKMLEVGGGGAIVCTASALATMGGDCHTDYIMSKHAVLGLVRAASMQLGEHGIRVNCVSPGYVATPLAAELGLSPGDLENVFGPVTSLKGAAITPEHVAEAVLFLASDESAVMTGHDLVVSGGLISMPPVKKN